MLDPAGKDPQWDGSFKLRYGPHFDVVMGISPRQLFDAFEARLKYKADHPFEGNDCPTCGFACIGDMKCDCPVKKENCPKCNSELIDGIFCRCPRETEQDVEDEIVAREALDHAAQKEEQKPAGMAESDGQAQE